jgi:hypothetical protein
MMPAPSAHFASAEAQSRSAAPILRPLCIRRSAIAFRSDATAPLKIPANCALLRNAAEHAYRAGPAARVETDRGQLTALLEVAVAPTPLTSDESIA